MPPHWTSRMARRAREAGRVFRTDPRSSHYEDADARRMRSELDAIRARFPHHS
ncbi:hypothetical protein [Mycolicibacterium hodleri]|uniref:hypothetical protein n=1 Tax=Mycolicibacterium hodleri TaxID=49897 RepID=UPI00147778FC|nr:hypothetical protein [Mycolicibacterium hodleri]